MKKHEEDLEGYQIWITKGCDLGPSVTLHLGNGTDVEFMLVGEIPGGDDSEDSEPEFIEVTNHDSEGREFLQTSDD